MCICFKFHCTLCYFCVSLWMHFWVQCYYPTWHCYWYITIMCCTICARSCCCLPLSSLLGQHPTWESISRHGQICQCTPQGHPLCSWGHGLAEDWSPSVTIFTVPQAGSPLDWTLLGDIGHQPCCYATCPSHHPSDSSSHPCELAKTPSRRLGVSRAAFFWLWRWRPRVWSWNDSEASCCKGNTLIVG